MIEAHSALQDRRAAACAGLRGLLARSATWPELGNERATRIDIDGACVIASRHTYATRQLRCSSRGAAREQGPAQCSVPWSMWRPRPEPAVVGTKRKSVDPWCRAKVKQTPNKKSPMRADCTRLECFWRSFFHLRSRKYSTIRQTWSN